jgi:hypothetical protein
MIRTSKNQKQTRRLALGKATLRILSQVQMANVNGGDDADTVGVCVTTQGYPCKDPGIATSQC